MPHILFLKPYHGYEFFVQACVDMLAPSDKQTLNFYYYTRGAPPTIEKILVRKGTPHSMCMPLLHISSFEEFPLSIQPTPMADDEEDSLSETPSSKQVRKKNSQKTPSHLLPFISTTICIFFLHHLFTSFRWSSKSSKTSGP